MNLQYILFYVCFGTIFSRAWKACILETTADLCIDKILVPPDGERHHGVAVGHDNDGKDVLGDEDESVVDTAPPLFHPCKAGYYSFFFVNLQL